MFFFHLAKTKNEHYLWKFFVRSLLKDMMMDGLSAGQDNKNIFNLKVSGSRSKVKNITIHRKIVQLFQRHTLEILISHSSQTGISLRVPSPQHLPQLDVIFGQFTLSCNLRFVGLGSYTHYNRIVMLKKVFSCKFTFIIAEVCHSSLQNITNCLGLLKMF